MGYVGSSLMHMYVYENSGMQICKFILYHNKIKPTFSESSGEGNDLFSFFEIVCW